MSTSPSYLFNLPPEQEVLKRNRTITTYYAQLYQNEPELYKWAGMAAFASFHIGKRLELWDWDQSGIKTFEATCVQKNRTIEDDFQVIRILNNKIFSKVGQLHQDFAEMEFQFFKKTLIEAHKHPLIINAFEKLHRARTKRMQEGLTASCNALIWEANVEILWHEQSEVVQPLFDRLSSLFSRAMTFFASFDYTVNHKKTPRLERSRFILFMLFKGFSILKKSKAFPELTHLEHRWHWICNDILRKWKMMDADAPLITSEIQLLSIIEERHLKIIKHS